MIVITCNKLASGQIEDTFTLIKLAEHPREKACKRKWSQLGHGCHKDSHDGPPDPPDGGPVMLSDFC